MPFQVEIAFAKKVQKHDYATSYRYIVEKSQKSLMVQLFSMCGHRYRKVMFIVFQFFYTLVFIHLAYFSYVWLVITDYIFGGASADTFRS